VTTTEPTQQILDLEIPVPDHYDIELRQGPSGEKMLRKHEASNPDDALAFVEALRDMANQRYMVTWQTEEPVQSGKMFGLAPGGVVYEIAVVPPLDLS
jgi:hypothetical protein